MEVLLDIKDSKADAIMSLLKDLPYVKIKPVRSKNQEFLDGLKEAVEEVKLAKQGKIKLKTARQLLDEI